MDGYLYKLVGEATFLKIKKNQLISMDFLHSIGQSKIRHRHATYFLGPASICLYICALKNNQKSRPC
jgi:hypothetical protein